MKRNKKEERKKKILRLRQEMWDIYDAIGNQGWIELEKPIHRGWNAEYVVREDFARGKHGRALQEVLDICGVSVFSRREDFKYKCYDTKKWEVKLPEFGSISEEEFETLSGEAKRYFWCSDNPRYVRKTYDCIVEKWKYTVVKSKNYLTHYREHDEVLYQMIGEIEAKIEGEYYGEFWKPYNNGGLGDYIRAINKGARRNNNIKLRNAVVAYNSECDEHEDYIFDDRDGDKSWYW